MRKAHTYPVPPVVKPAIVRKRPQVMLTLRPSSHAEGLALALAAGETFSRWVERWKSVV